MLMHFDVLGGGGIEKHESYHTLATAVANAETWFDLHCQEETSQGYEVAEERHRSEVKRSWGGRGLLDGGVGSESA